MQWRYKRPRGEPLSRLNCKHSFCCCCREHLLIPISILVGHVALKKQIIYYLKSGTSDGQIKLQNLIETFEIYYIFIKIKSRLHNEVAYLDSFVPKEVILWAAQRVESRVHLHIIET